MHNSGTAFAVNLLGAMVGGALEYLSLITGYRVLLIVIGVLYGLAFVTGPRRGGGYRAAPGVGPGMMAQASRRVRQRLEAVGKPVLTNGAQARDVIVEVMDIQRD